MIFYDIFILYSHQVNVAPLSHFLALQRRRSIRQHRLQRGRHTMSGGGQRVSETRSKLMSVSQYAMSGGGRRVSGTPMLLASLIFT